MRARKPIDPKDAAMAGTVKQAGRYIVADPKVCHGKLTFRGTRIFVPDVLEQVERGMPWDTIVEEWEGRLPPAAISEAVRLARGQGDAMGDSLKTCAIIGTVRRL